MIELTWMVMVEIAILAWILECIDSATGQFFGTLGSPILILIGFSPAIVVPSILLSQAMGGIIATYFHNKYKNADFSNTKTLDIKKVYIVVICGIIGVIIGAMLGLKVSKDVLTTFIGVVVLSMGIVIISGVRIKFTWPRMMVLGTVAGGLKVTSGGGYGPTMTGGQVIISSEGKNAIGVTDFAEFPICLAGFILWATISQSLPPLGILIPMCIGASLAPMVGCWLTYKLHNTRKLNFLLGIIILILGILCLSKVLNP
ncbi:MAG: TSUP family transporter [Candidatus Aenigmarchaeota archaeon]|nr:TSUP family transporter [Candidatus Aenigmarchaeota archaeon]